MTYPGTSTLFTGRGGVCGWYCSGTGTDALLGVTYPGASTLFIGREGYVVGQHGTIVLDNGQYPWCIVLDNERCRRGEIITVSQNQ